MIFLKKLTFDLDYLYTFGSQPLSYYNEIWQGDARTHSEPNWHIKI